MKVTIKTLKKEEFHYDVESSQTVKQLKEEIEKTQGHPVANQKLIFAGKILSDGDTLETAGVQDSNFLVLMVKRARRSKSRKSTPTKPSSTTTSSTNSTDSAQKPPSTSPAPTTNTNNTTTTTTTTTNSGGDEKPATDNDNASTQTNAEKVSSGDDAFEAKVTQLMGMGFPREAVVQALMAAFEDLPRATDYLLNGIPDAALELLMGAGGGASPAPPSTNTPSTNTPSTNTPSTPSSGGGDGGNIWQQAAQQQQQSTGGGAGGAGGDDPLSVIRNHPHLDQIRLAIRANPQVLPYVLQQIAQTYPEVYNAIAQNQQEFAAIINGTGGPPMGATGGTGATPGFGGAMQENQGGQHVVYLSPTDREAIERLRGLGFSEQRSVEAYLAFDKNENAAAGFLLDNSFEDDTQAALQQSMTDDSTNDTQQAATDDNQQAATDDNQQAATDDTQPATDDTQPATDDTQPAT
eukprot:CAMPEP_0201545984 /NCGR_PEP_ID=MMETSP0173_2-20130828/2381_1 /ASSEMBLY_ACC=CAM_ASM_000268 /TAXON_ID=218659 /ORGANISM="Vexillifera sp., Strain DIVA3 564/2" /LENGTH=463 /DNA_ID=CAMNT_0047954549 /DNA_START=21 /DNA_END=1408 /DNA_ORIENTATION=+